MVATILTLTALLTLAALATPATAESPADYCIEQVAERPALRKDASRPTRDRNVPYSVPGLPVEISNPSEGRVEFRDPATGHTTEMWFPSGDDYLGFNYYDAPSGRLYGDSHAAGIGWIEFQSTEAGIEPTDSGMVRPRLTWDPRSSGTWSARYSPALRLGFYTGYTTWWCCEALRKQRTYEFDIDEGKGRRIPDFWWLRLAYVGDDPVTGRAVLEEHETRERYWHDGRRVFRPKPGETGPLAYWTDDPLSDGQLLRDEAGRPWRFDGTKPTQLDPRHVLDGRVYWTGYRPAFDRWIIATATNWYVYRKGRPLKLLEMPDPAATWSWHTNQISPPANFPNWIISSNGLWWEEETGARTIVIPEANAHFSEPDPNGLTADGDAIAFALDTEPEQPNRTWYIIRHKRPSESCTLPGVLTIAP
ncbi:hypothetical protein [Amaricoccus tamworthensis]|uniref:hypothetical protein n=1 Tax=Amaricoccus tamworthensis TaxID=57002 RepID=UPI003C79D94C